MRDIQIIKNLILKYHHLLHFCAVPTESPNKFHNENLKCASKRHKNVEIFFGPKKISLTRFLLPKMLDQHWVPWSFLKHMFNVDCRVSRNIHVARLLNLLL